MKLSAFDFFAFLWAFFGVLLATLCLADDWQATGGVLMIGQAFCAVIVRRRFKATARAALPDFLSIVLLMQLFSRSMTLAGLVVQGNVADAGLVGDVLAVREIVPFQYQFQAELVFLLASVVFTAAWRLLEGRNALVVPQEPSAGSMLRAYLITLSLYLLLTASGVGSSLGMTVELLRLFSVGAVAVLLGGKTEFGLGKRKSWIPLLALLPLYVVALSTGMKGEAALVSLPILLPIFRQLTAARGVVLAGCAMTIVLFLFPFTQEWRLANWEHAGGGGGQQASISEVASRVVERWEREGMLETAAESTAKWLTRGASAEQGGLVMQLAERDGFIGPVLVEGIATIFIPRFLWPDKPLFQPGAWFTWYLGNADSVESASSSTAMMLPTELYWMFGVSGVVGGMSLIAVIYFLVCRYLMLKSVGGVIPLVGFFALIARAAGLQEIHTVYALSSPVILMVYVILFDRLQKTVFPGLFRSHARYRV